MVYLTQLKESYTYDETGNRIKTVNPNGTNYYVYDASGNVMAIYTGTTPAISEVPVYGGDRLGTYTPARLSVRACRINEKLVKKTEPGHAPGYCCLFAFE